MAVEPDDGFDAVCRLLRSQRRRHLLSLLFEREVSTVEQLGRQVAVRECGGPNATVDAADRRAVTISLVHNHLPRLADHGLLEYDARSGDVVLTPGGHALEPILERASDGADAPSAPASTPDSPTSFSGRERK